MLHARRPRHRHRHPSPPSRSLAHRAGGKGARLHLDEHCGEQPRHGKQAARHQHCRQPGLLCAGAAACRGSVLHRRRVVNSPSSLTHCRVAAVYLQRQQDAGRMHGRSVEQALPVHHAILQLLASQHSTCTARRPPWGACGCHVSPRGRAPLPPAPQRASSAPGGCGHRQQRCGGSRDITACAGRASAGRQPASTCSCWGMQHEHLSCHQSLDCPTRTPVLLRSLAAVGGV